MMVKWLEVCTSPTTLAPRLPWANMVNIDIMINGIGIRIA
jgi:hypothetical protein